MEMPEAVQHVVEKARRRVQSQRRWRAWLGYLVFVSTACLALAVVSRFVYVPYSGAVVACTAAAGALVAAILARRVGVDTFWAAAQLDLAEGLRERLSTLVEVSAKENSSEVIEALASDAAHAARAAQPQRSLLFYAPRTLPATLAAGIAAVAVIFATPLLGRPHSGRSKALRDSIRTIHATASLLAERGAPAELTDQLNQLSKKLKEGADVDLALQPARSCVEEGIEKAKERDELLHALHTSEKLRELTKLLRTNATQEEVAREAAAVMEKNAPEAAAIIEEVIKRLKSDSKLHEELTKALKAAQERARKAFLDAMEKIRRELATTLDARDLKLAQLRMKSVEKKLGAGKAASHANVYIPGAHANGAAQPDVIPAAASPDSGLDEIMEKEKVPERFKSLVRAYFARSNQEGRR